MPGPTVTSPFIALLTDYGWQDAYVAQLKGAILSVHPSARLIDLCHDILPFNITQGAYLLDQAAMEFPAGTIFVAVVDPEVGTKRHPLLIETTAGKFYLGPDNGLFTRVIEREKILRIWRPDQPAYFRPGAVSCSFHGRDIFGPAAAHLAMGTPPEKLGTALDPKSLALLPNREPSLTDNLITTNIQHIDRFGNIILDLAQDSDIARRLKTGGRIEIVTGKINHRVPLIRTYGEIPPGHLALLYGSSRLLELAINQGSAAKALKVAPGEAIVLKP